VLTCCIYNAVELHIKGFITYSLAYLVNGDMTMSEIESELPNELEPNARHFLRCEMVLALIETLEKPTLEDIVSRAGLPKRTVHAIFKRLTDQHRVLIKRVNGRRHGYYDIADWGNLDRNRVVTHVQGHLRSETGEMTSNKESVRQLDV
jgi:hypothetical protein